MLYVHVTNDAKAALQIKMINEYGNLVLEQTMEAGATENVISVPVSNLAPGIYELLLLQRDGVPVGRARVIKI